MTEKIVTDRSLDWRHLMPSLELVPPMSDDFGVYGGVDTNERARNWAIMHHYLLVRGAVPACAHGFYLMNCPNTGACIPGADHTEMWVPDSGPQSRVRVGLTLAALIMRDPDRLQRIIASGNIPTDDELDVQVEAPGEPFILTHPYANRVPTELRAYARAHGLYVSCYPGQDAWYGGGTIPIRLTLRGRVAAWPINIQSDVLCSMLPTTWPPEDEEIGWADILDGPDRMSQRVED